MVLLVSLQHLPNQCWILSIPVAIDGGIVVQFGTRPRRRRQQQSFGLIWVTRLYGHYVMILIMCMVKACFSLLPHSILIHLGEKYITTTQQHNNTTTLTQQHNNTTTQYHNDTTTNPDMVFMYCVVVRCLKKNNIHQDLSQWNATSDLCCFWDNAVHHPCTDWLLDN